MNKELFNILSNSNKDIDNQKLMDYLSGQLNQQETHELEKLLSENDFMNDAVEGLQSLRDQKHIPHIVEQLNRDLHKKLQAKKSRKEKRRIKSMEWVYYAIIIILMLVIISYLILRKVHS